MLTGGAGADIFKFEALTDMSLTATTSDTVKDFSHLQLDLIDLSLIDADSTQAGDQGFGFIGAAAFGNHAGELRYEVSAANTTVFGDVDGNGVADFAIQLLGVSTLVATDFIY